MMPKKSWKKIQPSTINEWNDFEKFCTKVGMNGNHQALYTYSLCGATKTGIRDAIEHVESAHFKGTFSYPCEICGSVSKTKGVFRKHNNLKHN